MHPGASSELMISKLVHSARPWPRLQGFLATRQASVAGSLLLDPLPKDVTFEAPAYLDL